MGGCELLGGASAIAAQLSLAFVALCSLCIKRHTERPRRPFNVWVFDVSKQAFAAGAAHGCGMLWAILMHRFTDEGASECAWYFVVFTVDTTCGVAVALYLHAHVLQYAAKLVAPANGGPLGEGVISKVPPYVRTWAHHVSMCGYYGDPPSVRVFLPQMLEFVLCVIAGRVVCGATVFTLAGLLGFIARWMDALFYALFPDPAVSAHAELWAVMVLGPLTMNVVQVLVQDAFLKFRARSAATGVATGSQPLLEPHSKPFHHEQHNVLPSSPAKQPRRNAVGLV